MANDKAAEQTSEFEKYYNVAERATSDGRKAACGRAWNAALQRACELADQVATEVGGEFADTHRLNIGFNMFRKRIRALMEKGVGQ